LTSEALQEQFLELPTYPIEFAWTYNYEANFPFHSDVFYNFFEDRLLLFPTIRFSVDSSKFQDGKDCAQTYATCFGQFAQKRQFLFQDYEEFIDLKTNRGFEAPSINHCHQKWGGSGK